VHEILAILHFQLREQQLFQGCALCFLHDLRYFYAKLRSANLPKLKWATNWSLFPQCTTLLVAGLVRSRAVWAEVFESEVVYT
jgi:hypothetical protein